jgi:predicted O-linked N-acetylglucosamine transferase (SPINDLY family)
MNRKQRRAAVKVERTRGDSHRGTATTVVSDAGTPRAKKPISAALQAKFQQGLALHQQGRFAEAERAYQEILQQEPTYFDALHLLGVVACQTRRTQRSVELIAKAIELNPYVAAAHSNLGFALKDLKRYEDAVASYDKAIALKPDYAEAHNNRGNALNALQRPEEALAGYAKAIALKPDYAQAHNNRAAALNHLKRHEEALASSDKAIALKPDYAEAYNNRGNALNDLKRHEEAIASYDKAITLKPDNAEAHNNRGAALYDIKRREEALASYDKAIALKPDNAEAFNNRGNALKDMKRYEEAIASYDKAIALKPDYAEAYNNRGNALKDLKRYEEAIASYEKAIALKPDCEFLLGELIHTKMKICDWSNLESQIAQLVHKIDHAEKVSQPFPLLVATRSPELQRKAAEIYVIAKYPLNNALSKIAKRQRGDKIRIGYFSTDFRAHPVAFLAAELFERHNRSQFKLTAFSFGLDTKDDMRRRLEVAFDKFIDVRTRSDRDVVLLARQLEIDIAVDLGGFTTDSRTNIFSMRAAPVQVSYLGYAATMGTEYIDYLIADLTVIPESDKRYYAEKIVYLPNTYQPNDTKRCIAGKMFTRAEVGLPQEGFVFCCFNNNYKITPQVFDCWMRILTRVDGSVLWLSETNATATSNLKREAGIRGINPGRLVFAKHLPLLADHLARHRLGDLFLDTLPYNAHATASDALWAGLPVLTRIGETFVGRIAASLLTAIRLPELITSTPQEYEHLAIELATNDEKLAAIKHKLANNRLTTPLFDTQRFTKHIETAYTAMYERYQAGLPPDHMYVPQ